MDRLFVTTVIGSALLCMSAPQQASASSESSVASAYKLCQAFDATGLTSEKCEVSGFGSSVNVRMDMDASEARKTCAGVAQLASAKGWLFDSGWTIKIFSPYSGDHPIATCSV